MYYTGLLLETEILAALNIGPWDFKVCVVSNQTNIIDGKCDEVSLRWRLKSRSSAFFLFVVDAQVYKSFGGGPNYTASQPIAIIDFNADIIIHIYVVTFIEITFKPSDEFSLKLVQT